MLKRSLIIISVLVAITLIPLLIIQFGLPPLVLQNSTGLEYKSYGTGSYQIEAKYPSRALSNLIKVRLTVMGPSNKVVDFFGYGDAVKIFINQSSTTVYADSFQTLSFNNEGTADFLISFDSGETELHNYNFTINVRIGEFVSGDRVSYREYQNDFKVFIIPTWIYGLCLVIDGIIGIIIAVVIDIREQA